MLGSFTYIELFGVAFGIICVFLTIYENIWCWPTGIVSVVLYAIFYYQQTLYASMYLQGVFLVYCILGWYQWLYGGENKTKLTVTKTRKSHIWKMVLITIAMFAVMGLLFDLQSDDKQPYLDSFVTAMSFTAQWMMNNKLVESWLLWIVIDITYAVMHFHMENYPSFVLYAVYVFAASFGYYLWLKSSKNTSSVL